MTADYTLPDGHVLVLRSADSDRRSHDGFQWPESGHVEAPDWDPDPTVDCGHGLHGLVWGQGDVALTSPRDPNRVWQVVEVATIDIADIDAPDKVRFRAGTVVLSTVDRAEAAAFVQCHAPPGVIAHFGTATAGDYGTATAGHFGTATAGDSGTATAGDSGTVVAGDSGTATAGYFGTATAGYSGTATAGYSGTATAGDSGTATAGDYGTATAGRYGTATAGRYGTATAGYYGTATAGYYGTATAGDHGTATAGNSGTATAGDSGTATAGDSGTATAGDSGTIVIKWWDGERYRLAVGYVGEDGIEPDVAYKCVEGGRLVPA